MMNMKIQFIGLHMLIGLSFLHASDTKINYRSNDQYEEIWNDSGSDSLEPHNVSIWRLTHLQKDYCSLGDVAISKYHLQVPDIKSISVETSSPGVEHPLNFTQIWNATGIGSSSECTVYNMSAPPGYTCLGSVAMRSYAIPPDPQRYCCIQDDFLVPATVVWTYYVERTNPDIDLSVWTIEKIADSHGIEGNNFMAVNGHIPPYAMAPPRDAFLLNGQKATKASEEKIKTINYQSNDKYEEIWNDRGSNSLEPHNVSIWRLTHLHKDYCSLGDVASTNYHLQGPDIKYISVETSSQYVKHPLNFTQIWNDTGTGARLNCALYKMKAPAGFTCLGSAAMSSYVVRPDPTRYCCIHDDFRVQASVKGTYFAQWTNTSIDISLWTTVKTSNSHGIGGINFLALIGYIPPMYRHPSRNAYILNGQMATKVERKSD